MKKFTVVLSRGLPEKVSLKPATQLATELYDRYLRPRDYQPPVLSKASNFTLNRWNDIQVAFKYCYRVETHIYTFVPGYLKVELRFYLKGMKKPVYEVHTLLDINSGQLEEPRGASLSPEFMELKRENPDFKKIAELTSKSNGLSPATI